MYQDVIKGTYSNIISIIYHNDEIKEIIKDKVDALDRSKLSEIT